MALNILSGANFGAILVSGAASLVIGFVWYGPLFGKAWGSYTGWTEAKIKTIPGSRMALTYGLSFIAAVIAAAVLAFLARTMGATSVMDGAALGLLTGIGILAMGFATTFLFEHKPVGLWLIVAGYEVVYLVTAGIIVTLWR